MGHACKKSEGSTNRTQSMVHSGVASALGAILSLIIVYRMPQGGSICLGAFVPVWVIAFRYGVRAGMLCGGVLGIINFLQNPSAIHPLQPVIDYFIAWACLGFAGFFPQHMVFGAVLSGLCQICCYIISGALFFAATLGATDTLSAFYLSAVYNLSFGIPNLIVAVSIMQGINAKAPHLFQRS
jgi:thiamine transporter